MQLPSKWRKRLENEKLDTRWQERHITQIARNSKRMETYLAKVTK